jgi:hypothetical protein
MQWSDFLLWYALLGLLAMTLQAVAMVKANANWDRAGWQLATAAAFWPVIAAVVVGLIVRAAYFRLHDQVRWWWRWWR